MLEKEKSVRLVKACQKNQIKQIKSLYRQAFPAAERKPFFLIQSKCREGVVEMLSIEGQGGIFLGLAIVMLDGDIALLDYFAISPECRGSGAGTAAFGLLRKRYEQKRFILEIESTEAAPDDEIRKQRCRRKNFYLRNGMTVLPFTVKVFGVDMEMLSHGCNVSFSEYKGVYEHLYGGRLAERKILLTGISRSRE